MQVLQTTPYEYLINYRIKKSLELLGKEKTPISQIALEVGFNDVSHFIQSLKKE
ncbi:MAG: helix-turn-helix domain-containing protein [Faecalibacillus intestinalis]|uniref:helix-turn-helix domain-containing protein n=1 Tax=Faecalibacillus TaxID=2678885 RepID=UPI0022233680|nr:helix-turn-helix domain-containing protein [Faecalibacillus sp. MSK20_93]